MSPAQTGGNGHGNQANITINDAVFEIARGSHRVAELKALAGLPATGELGELRNGGYHALQDNQSVAIQGDEKFRSPEIIVNGTQERWLERDITYAQVATLFDPEYPQHPDVTYSITYDHGPSENREGILSQGGTVRIKERMVFNVKRTGES